MGVSGHHVPVWYDEDAPPEDGEAMTWNAAARRWEPREVSGEASGTIDGGTP